MNDMRTIGQLEQDLRDGDAEVLGTPDLAGIRGRGRSRRRRGLAAYVGGTAAGLIAAGALVGVATHGDDADAPDRTPAATTPTELSPLAERVLREIPGAVQVSDWQVLIPDPGSRPQYGEETVPAEYIDAGPIDIGAHSYDGVTAFERGAFPTWLYRGVEDFEKSQGSEEEGYPVGSTDMGIIVDSGPQDLACMRPLPQWGGDGDPDACFPAMLGEKPSGARTYAWGMGTDDFLQPGEDLELFSTEVYGDGGPSTVWIGGTDGTEVATVTLVSTDGTRVDATVAPGTLVPDETMFWGTVAGDLAVAVTRDADGTVLERHVVKPCDDPVECEVR